MLTSLLRDDGLDMKDVEYCVISSVVPVLIGSFVSLIEQKTGRKPVIINPTIFPLLPVRIPETAIHEIGSDLLCNAVEAYCRYQCACIVVDFGTALTFTAVGATGDLLGIAITPGLGAARNSLLRIQPSCLPFLWRHHLPAWGQIPFIPFRRELCWATRAWWRGSCGR